MTGPRAPAGWYPDPDDHDLIRYWDGAAWTEHSARSAHGSPETRPPPAEPRSTVQGTVVREDRAVPAWATVAIAALVAVLVVLAISIGEDEEAGHPYGRQPPQQRAVVELIQDARRAYDAAEHDLQRNAALADRDERICALLGNGRVENWTGTISEIDSAGDDAGALSISIEADAEVATRGSAFADPDDTLIGPGPLLDRITELEEGQVVTFSGRFVPDEESCFSNRRLTQRQQIDNPLMVFRFSDVRR